jgi:alkylation response protein AidB-like acyl-CoA dehydrogenase
MSLSILGEGPERRVPDLLRVFGDARILNFLEAAAEIRAQLIAQSLLEGGKWIGSAPISQVRV